MTAKRHTIITEHDGKETILQWEQSDTFCSPSWRKFRLVNERDETAYLISFSDSPLLKNLDIYQSK
ncbi:uncharacterized protein AC631_05985 [Debaryomyces fabryi]|uniref:Uncharacterized protein n=1 Tax=Debaryomyces fabryi TaxID=58627 RepID=A0A0V1PPT6_9ASCO|nr:uncharacterized protein AC631_05985 [Debaryomyces fabryi]KRZ98256.1 hypothetical protein AC631_05985 [Debaryomyces fabryi]